MRFYPEGLHALALLAEEGSVSAVARRLHLSQPAVSQRLARLAQLAGAPLFVRTKVGVRLTPAGRRLLPAAQALLHAERLAGATERLPLALAASQTVASHFLPARLTRLAARYALRVRLANTEQALEMLARAEVDMAVVEGPVGACGHCWPLATDALVLALPRGHPLLGKRHADPDDLDGLPMLMREPGSGTRALVEAELSALGVRPKVLAEIEGLAPLLAAVDAGIGPAILPRVALGRRIPHRRIRGVRLARAFTLVAPKHLAEEGAQIAALLKTG